MLNSFLRLCWVLKRSLIKSQTTLILNWRNGRRPLCIPDAGPAMNRSIWVHWWLERLSSIAWVWAGTGKFGLHWPVSFILFPSFSFTWAYWAEKFIAWGSWMDCMCRNFVVRCSNSFAKSNNQIEFCYLLAKSLKYLESLSEIRYTFSIGPKKSKAIVCHACGGASLKKIQA